MYKLNNFLEWISVMSFEIQFEIRYFSKIIIYGKENQTLTDISVVIVRHCRGEYFTLRPYGGLTGRTEFGFL